MTALDQHYELTDEPGNLGLNCKDTGLSLAGVPLLRMSVGGFAPRPTGEIGVLMKRAYGQDIDATGLIPRLGVIADALNRGDVGRAKIAALHLRLAALKWDAAVSIAQADRALTKYDPDEPRDERGRWTSGGGTNSGGSATANSRIRPMPAGPIGQRQGGSAPSRPALPEAISTRESSDAPGFDDAGGSGRPYGGQLLFPWRMDQTWALAATLGRRREAELIPEVETGPGRALRVPEGWDTPGQVIDGLDYPPTRNPTLPDGTPWPRATPELIQAVLAPQRGTPPSMVVFVPLDGVGPVLVGSTATFDSETPKGYDSVKLIGTPQVTKSRRQETGHAKDSINEALRLAASNEFSMIYFNRSFSHITGRAYESLIRPDVVGVARPFLDLPYQYSPYESLSPGQKLPNRQAEMPPIPGIKPVRGEYYKRFARFSPEHLRILGVRAICL